MFKPSDIEEQRFEVSFRGYNTNEVDEFMHRVQMDYSEFYSDLDTFSRKIAAAELKVKEAEDRTDEFIESMQADRDAADAYAAEKREEGERIIREAKNAAAGIMSEVKRRAIEVAKAAEAKAQATEKGAKKSAEALVTEANTQANAIIREAQEKAAEIESKARAAAEAERRAALLRAEEELADTTARAKEAGAYIEKVYSTTDKACRDIERELRSTASRIALLGRRPEDIPAKAPVTEVSAKAPAPKAAPAPAAAKAPAEDDADAIEVIKGKTAPAPAKKAPAPAPEKAPAEEEEEESIEIGGSIAKGGYFTEEYKQAMAELFGGDGTVISAPDGDDDDTYDFYDKAVLEELRRDSAEAEDEDVYTDEDDDSAVTSEYVGTSDKDDLASSTLESIFRAPSADDLKQIFDNM